MTLRRYALVEVLNQRMDNTLIKSYFDNKR